MSKTISVDAKTLEAILHRLDQLAKDIEAIKEKLFDQEPEEGTDEWWEWSDKKAMEEIKRGEYYEMHNSEELKDLLNNVVQDGSNEKYYHLSKKKTSLLF